MSSEEDIPLSRLLAESTAVFTHAVTGADSKDVDIANLKSEARRRARGGTASSATASASQHSAPPPTALDSRRVIPSISRERRPIVDDDISIVSAASSGLLERADYNLSASRGRAARRGHTAPRGRTAARGRAASASKRRAQAPALSEDEEIADDESESEESGDARQRRLRSRNASSSKRPRAALKPSASKRSRAAPQSARARRRHRGKRDDDDDNDDDDEEEEEDDEEEVEDDEQALEAADLKWSRARRSSAGARTVSAAPVSLRTPALLYVVGARDGSGAHSSSKLRRYGTAADEYDDGTGFIAEDDEEESRGSAGAPDGTDDGSDAGINSGVAFYMDVERKRVAAAEREERLRGLGIFELDFSTRRFAKQNAGGVSVSNEVAMDAYLRFIAAALVVPSRLRSVLDARSSPDAKLFRLVAKQTETALFATTRSLAQSQSWAQASAVGGLAFAVKTMPLIESRVLAQDAFDVEAWPNCEACGRRDHPARHLVTLRGPLVPLMSLFCADGDAAGGVSADSAWLDSIPRGRMRVHSFDFYAGGRCNERLIAFNASVSWKFSVLGLVSRVLRRALSIVPGAEGDGGGGGDGAAATPSHRESIADARTRISEELVHAVVYSRRRPREDGALDSDEDGDLKVRVVEEGDGPRIRDAAAHDRELVRAAPRGAGWVTLARERALEIEMGAPRETAWLKKASVTQLRAATWASDPHRRRFLRTVSPFIFIMAATREVERVSATARAERRTATGREQRTIRRKHATVDYGDDSDGDGETYYEEDVVRGRTVDYDESSAGGESESDQLLSIEDDDDSEEDDDSNNEDDDTTNDDDDDDAKDDASLPPPRVILTADERKLLPSVIARVDELFDADDDVRRAMNIDLPPAPPSAFPTGVASRLPVAPAWEEIRRVFDSPAWKTLVTQQVLRVDAIGTHNKSLFATASSKKEREAEASSVTFSGTSNAVSEETWTLLNWARRFDDDWEDEEVELEEEDVEDVEDDEDDGDGGLQPPPRTQRGAEFAQRRTVEDDSDDVSLPPPLGASVSAGAGAGAGAGMGAGAGAGARYESSDDEADISLGALLMKAGRR